MKTWQLATRLSQRLLSGLVAETGRHRRERDLSTWSQRLLSGLVTETSLLPILSWCRNACSVAW